MSKELAEVLQKSKNTVFFGGAGVSTESGIPDFRSVDGLYSAREVYGHTPEEIISHSFFLREPEMFFRYYKENLIHAEAQPNGAHIALAKLEEMGILKAVVTQNIDGLHQRAGSKTVWELHGSVLRNSCINCGETYPLEAVTQPRRARGAVPLCEKCDDGVIRPEVVLYGESLDDEVVSGAIAAIERADTMIVGGTSLAVYPAAGLLEYFRGGTLVLLNRTATAFDKRADLILRDSIAGLLSQAVALL